MTDWKETTIQEVAVVNELSLKKGREPTTIEYIDIASVDKGQISEKQIISFDKAPSRARRIVRDNDILISTVRPNLEHYTFVKTASKNTIASTGFAVVSAKKADPRFLYYILTQKSFTEYLTRIADGHTSAYPAFNPDVIENAKINIPPLPVQEHIAHILGSLDDKIELNRRMNETLEAIVRALFKSWFVDFDPVKAKAECSDPKLPKEIADLFPDSFKESELGPIPKGWKVSTIGEEVTITGGGTPSTKKKEFWENGTTHFTTPRDLRDILSPVLLDTERKITKLGLSKVSSGLLPRGTVLLSSRAPIGYLAIAEIPVAVNQGFIAMVCDETLPIYYVLFWVRSNMEIIKSHANGTTFLEISKKNFKPIKILVPQETVLDKYVSLIEPIYKQIVSNLKENIKLAAIQNTLLPKLVSGDLPVGEVDIDIGDQR